MQETRLQILRLAVVVGLALLLVSLAGLLGGCIKETIGGETFWQVDPNHPAVGAAETVVGVGADAAAALSPIWPALAGVGTVMSGVLGLWVKKIKPQVVQKQTEVDMLKNAAGGVVAAIEELKATSPESWEKLKGKLRDVLGPQAVRVIEELLKEQQQKVV